MLLNYTPHDISFIDDKDQVKAIPSVGLAYCEVDAKHLHDIEIDGETVAPIYQSNFDELEGLPEPIEGVTYIVSLVTKNAANTLGRTDVVSPYGFVRDDNGKIIGCRGFSY